MLHVHDLADWVSVEAEEAGRFAAAYVQERREESGRRIPVRAGEGVRYVLPQTISGERDFILSLRVTAPWRDRAVVIRDGSGKQIRKKKMMRLHPAEMIRIPVKKGAGMDGSHLEVSVE